MPGLPTLGTPLAAAAGGGAILPVALLVGGTNAVDRAGHASILGGGGCGGG